MCVCVCVREISVSIVLRVIMYDFSWNFASFVLTDTLALRYHVTRVNFTFYWLNLSDITQLTVKFF